MAFKVQIAAVAERDIDEAVALIQQNSSVAAQRWLQTLASQILGLAEMPARFAIIVEAEELNWPLRDFVHHSHRVVYEVDDAVETVSIVRVYHSARAPLQIEDLTD